MWATIKQLRSFVIPTLADDTPVVAVIHGGCNDLGHKSKEVLSTDDIVDAIFDIGKLC